MAKSLLRNNVGGLIFWTSRGKHKMPVHEGIEGWLEAGKPADCLVFDSPAQLIGAGFKIVDARKVNTGWFKAMLKVPAQSKIRLPIVVHKMLEMKDLPALDFPGMVFFDITSLKHKPKRIGTAAPSKISKGET